MAVGKKRRARYYPQKVRGRNLFMLRESYWILANILGENLCEHLWILLHLYTMYPTHFTSIWILAKSSSGESPPEWILRSHRISSPEGAQSLHNLTLLILLLCNCEPWVRTALKSCRERKKMK